MKTKVMPEKIVMGFHHVCGCFNSNVYVDSLHLETEGVPQCIKCDRMLDVDAFWEIEDDGVIVEPEMTLENWCGVPWNHKKLHGKIYHDSKFRFNDGDEIFTSEIVKVENGRVTTKTGSIYKLGTPNPSIFDLEVKEG